MSPLTGVVFHAQGHGSYPCSAGSCLNPTLCEVNHRRSPLEPVIAALLELMRQLDPAAVAVEQNMNRVRDNVLEEALVM